jgi:hypothetical protein
MENEVSKTNNQGPYNLGDLIIGPDDSFGPKIQKEEVPDNFCTLCKKERPTYDNGMIVPCDMCRLLGCLH